MVVIGGLAGGAAGYVAAKTVAGGFDSQLSQLWSRVSTPVVQVTTTTPPAQIVPLEAPHQPVYPVAFVNRTASSLLPLIKTTGLKLTEPLVLPNDHLQGYAVTLTSDGWLALPATALTSSITETGIIWDNRVYPITTAIRDRLAEIVFVKIDATGLPITHFASPVDVLPGLNVWIETQPRRFRPETLLAIDARAILDPVLSERVNRRYLVSLDGPMARPGMAVWRSDGKLVGLISTTDHTGTLVIPTTVLSAELSQVLATRVVQRAALNLRVQDLSSLIYQGVRPSWPEQGMLIRQVLSTSTAKLLQEGDVIERIDRDAFDGTVDLGERLLDYRPGTLVTIYGTRKGKTFQVDVPLQATTTSDLLK